MIVLVERTFYNKVLYISIYKNMKIVKEFRYRNLGVRCKNLNRRKSEKESHILTILEGYKYLLGLRA
jgi:hypothetical protein